MRSVTSRLLRRRTFGRALLAIAILLVVGSRAGSVASAQAHHKQVLVLYSTRTDNQFSIIGEHELPRILDVGQERTSTTTRNSSTCHGSLTRRTRS